MPTTTVEGTLDGEYSQRPDGHRGEQPDDESANDYVD